MMKDDRSFTVLSCHHKMLCGSACICRIFKQTVSFVWGLNDGKTPLPVLIIVF